LIFLLRWPVRFYTLPSSRSGTIASLDELEPPLGYWVEGHLLAQPDAVAPTTVATWSGTLAAGEGGGLFAADVRNWSQAAKGELHDKLDRLGKVAAFKSVPAQARLLLRPHARHILSDWHTCARFMAQRALAGDSRTGLLVDPAAMLTAQMLAQSADHLERTLEQAGLMLREDATKEQIGGVVVCNLKRAGGGGGRAGAAGAAATDPLGVDEGEALTVCTLDDPAGLLDVGHLVKLVRAHLVTGTPVVLVGGPGAGERQRAIVEG
jgi:hypothetical protein